MKLIRYTTCFLCLAFVGLWFAVPTLQAEINQQSAAESVAPTLTHVEPNNDMVTGGATVMIIGENFQDGAKVTIGGTAVSNVIFVSPTELIVEAPPDTVGSVDVVVTNPDGKSSTLISGFTYVEPPPTLTSVEPDNDTIAGGTSVQIIGENFQDGAAVTIGGNVASNVVFVSSTELTVEAPAGTAGSADVVVTNPNGESATLAGVFTYIEPPPPILTSIDPDNDMVAGGATVKIIGENFQAGVTVTIGGNEASSVVFVLPTELTVEAPAGTVGSVDVVVTNPDGKSATLAGVFTYIEPPPPTLTRVEPDTDVVTGGAKVQIIGENFQDGVTVTIGGNTASDVIFISPSELTVEVPAGTAGSVDVVVTNPDDKSSTLEGGFTYTFSPYDLNQDRIVNIVDLVTVADQFGETGTKLKGDIDGNGTVNILDLLAVANHFSQE